MCHSIGFPWGGGGGGVSLTSFFISKINWHNSIWVTPTILVIYVIRKCPKTFLSGWWCNHQVVSFPAVLWVIPKGNIKFSQEIFIKKLLTNFERSCFYCYWHSVPFPIPIYCLNQVKTKKMASFGRKCNDIWYNLTRNFA